MKKYISEYQVIRAEKYTDGLEDGYRIYYFFPPGKDGLTIKSFVTFKRKEDLKAWKAKMEEKEFLLNKVIPVVETTEGIREVSCNDYIVTTAMNTKFIINSEAFNILFEVE